MLHRLTETCEQVGIRVHGLIDSNYWGNTESICDVPVIDTEHSFADPDKLLYYKSNFNFFCATNWIPENNPVSVNNTKKRLYLLDLIKQYKLECITLADPDSQISKHSTVGRGVYIDWNVQINTMTTIGDFTNIYCGTVIGHHNTIGTNCVFQRYSMLIGDNTVGDNVYFGLCVKALKHGAKFGSGTIIHEAIYIRRGTVENEVVSMESDNLRRIKPYPFFVEDNHGT
jgi:hypothetical protein